MTKTYEINGVKFTTHYGEFSNDILNSPRGATQFDRAHAVLVTHDGRVLLRMKEGEIRGATGGHIDPEDENIEMAIRREVLEEAHCELDRMDYIGELEVIDADGHKEKWARVVARIAQILPPKPDPDRSGNWIYGRVLAPPEIAIAEASRNFPLNEEQITEALKVARKKAYFTELASAEYEVLNVESRDEPSAD